MTELTASGLKQLMERCLGTYGAPLAEDFLDLTFDELDFDSLARVELAEKLRESYGIDIPDEIAEQLTTPRDFLQHINDSAEKA